MWLAHIDGLIHYDVYPHLVPTCRHPLVTLAFIDNITQRKIGTKQLPDLFPATCMYTQWAQQKKITVILALHQQLNC